MDENLEKPPITAPIEVDASPARPSRLSVVFRWRDWLAVALGIALAALWFEVFSLERLLEIPGAGTTAFVLGALTAEAIYLRGKLCLKRENLYLAGCTVLLAVSCSLFGDSAVRLINLAFLSFLTPASALALAGRDFPAMTHRLIPETFRLFLPELFLHLPKPFQAIRRPGRSYRSFWIVVASLLVMLPLFWLVLTLLASADGVFRGLLGSFAESLGRVLSTSSIWTTLRTVFFGLMLFSFLYSLARPARPREALPSVFEGFPCLPFIAVLTFLNVIYAIFSVIQFVYLFGGAETASMHGGYAEYARSGFFQLVAVAGINLLSALVSQKAAGRGKRCVNVLLYLLIGLTFVILVSALTRMCLYISVFGLSLLRAMTLLGISYIAVCLAAVTYKTAKPAFKIFPVFVGVFLAFWLVFNYVNIDARIANYNVDAYLDGRTEELDAAYIAYGLSDSARPALERLRDELGGDYEIEPYWTLDQALAAESQPRHWANWYLFR